MTYRLNAADIPGPTPQGRGIWWRSQLPAELGWCINDVCHLDDGLALAYARYQPQYDLLEHSAIDRQVRSLTITVALEGESSTVDTDGQRFDFVSGHSTVAAFSRVCGQRRFPANRTTRQLRLIVHEALLQRYRLEHLLDGMDSGACARRIFFGKHDGATLRLAESLVHLHSRDASVLELQIAALSLLAEQTRALQPSAAAAAAAAADGDHQARMLRAREILLSQYGKPLTVAYLCSTVGTNEFKLKQGFRELFGTSPHRMLTDIRMDKARQLLETGLQVSTVAYQVGYQHPSSFSTAFERYYGKTPKSIARATRKAR